jgi:hypothetical protein
MLISVREAYKYARAHIVGDGLAPLSPLDVEERRVGRRRRQALRLAVIVRSRKPPPWLSPGYRMRWQCFPAGR